MDQRSVEHQEPESLLPDSSFCPFGELNNQVIPQKFAKEIATKVGTVVFHFSPSYPGSTAGESSRSRKFVWVKISLNPNLKLPELNRLKQNLQLKFVVPDGTEYLGVPETESPEKNTILIQAFFKPENRPIGLPLHLLDKELPEIGAVLIDRGQAKPA